MILDDDFGNLLMQRNNYKVSHVTYAVCTDLFSVAEFKTSLLRNSFVWLQSVGLTLQAHCSRAKQILCCESISPNEHSCTAALSPAVLCSFDSVVFLFLLLFRFFLGILILRKLQHLEVSSVSYCVHHNFPAMSRQPSAEQRHSTCSGDSGRAKRGPAPGMCQSFHP